MASELMVQATKGMVAVCPADANVANVQIVDVMTIAFMLVALGKKGVDGRFRGHDGVGRGEGPACGSRCLRRQCGDGPSSFFLRVIRVSGAIYSIRHTGRGIIQLAIFLERV